MDSSPEPSASPSPPPRFSPQTRRAPAGPSLDLSFGGDDTPMQVQKVNLLGSKLSPQAIHSLVENLSNITHLDLRGNRLDSKFAWNLVKAMNKRYLGLEYCNGVYVRGLRENRVKRLNLSRFDDHNGMYGIEVVGAVILAHFLRINSSLETFNFKRNDVQKEGAKALAQSILSNPASRVEEVNTMGVRKRVGVSLSALRAGTVQVVNLAKCMLDDEDMAFLTEFLTKHDSVTEIDVSKNLFCGEGLRKLCYYVSTSANLKRLTAVGLPADLDGVRKFAKALQTNKSLVHAAFTLGPALGTQPRQIETMMETALAVKECATLETFGVSGLKVGQLRSGDLTGFNPDRVIAAAPRAEVALYLCVLAATSPTAMTTFSFGSISSGTHEYPVVMYYPAGLVAPLAAVVGSMKHLERVQLALPTHVDLVTILRPLTELRALTHLKLMGCASLKVSEMPAAWAGDGALPGWCAGRLGSRRPMWQAIQGFLGQMPGLKVFNNVNVGRYTSPTNVERAMFVLFECMEGVSCESTTAEGGTKMSTYLSKEADIELLLVVLRLVGDTSLTIDMHLVSKVREVVAVQQRRLAKGLREAQMAGLPSLNHLIYLKTRFVTQELLEAAAVSPLLREVPVDRIETLLPTFVRVYGAGSQQQIERIRVDRQWLPSRHCYKRFTPEQKADLITLQKALGTSTALTEVVSQVSGRTPRARVGALALREFAELMSGVSVEEPPHAESSSAQVHLKVVNNPRDWYYPPEEYEQKWIEMPRGETLQGLRIVNLCMCEMRKVANMECRPDAWADSCRRIWRGPKRFVRPGAYDDGGADDVTSEGSGGEDDEAVRYHWNHGVTLGSKAVLESLGGAREFVDAFVRSVLRALFELDTIVDVDLRGNGLTEEDGRLVLELMKDCGSLERLNQLPLVTDEVESCDRLVVEGSGVVRPRPLEDGEEEDEDVDWEAQVFAEAALEASTVRIDPGDAQVLSALAPNFSTARTLRLGRVEISEGAADHMCACIMGLPVLEAVEMVEVEAAPEVSTKLTSALLELGTRLRSVNGVAVGRMESDRQPAEVHGAVWNEYSLAVTGRKHLWPQVESREELSLHLPKATDGGVRGLCGMLGLTDPGAPRVVLLDLSHNPHLTDSAVCDLALTLRQPHMRASLRELSVRWCPQLRARSAFELYHLLHGSTSGCEVLQVVNGVDLGVLRAALQSGKPGPPMVVRIAAGGERLSECDAHFYAHVLHLFPRTIPHCHIHVEMGPTARVPGTVESWRTTERRVGRASNDLPFLAAVGAAAEALEQLNTATAVFDACPVSAKLQVSMAPTLPVLREMPESERTDVVLCPQMQGAKANAAACGVFGNMHRRVADDARRREARNREDPATQLVKSCYKNNIARQRLHDCFRTLFGQDEHQKILREDLFPDNKVRDRCCVPAEAQVARLVDGVTSVDLQHVHLTHRNLETMQPRTRPLLTHLNLAHNDLGDRGAQVLMAGLPGAGVLVHLALGHNKITDVGAAAIAKGLSGLPKLTSLSLAANFIGESGGIHLARAVGGSILGGGDGRVGVFKLCVGGR